MYKIMTAGPTQVRENVRMARSLECTNPDLDPAFFDFYKETCELLSKAMHTENKALILGGEGILGLEAACASLTEPGDRVLVIDNGVFGKGFADFVKIYGGEPVSFVSDYHRPVELSELEAFLKEDSNFKYATVVHCDTPSGVLNDVEEISKLLDRYGIMTVADSVAGMFGEPLKIAIGAPSYYNITDETDFVLNLSEKCDVSSVKMGGEEVKFTVADNKITIAAADIPKSLAKGKVKLSLVINAVEYELSFEYDTEKKTYLLPFVDGKVTLAAGKVKAQGDLVVGYDGTIAEIHVDKITDDGAGGTYFMIGSYGVYLRGGGFRITEKHGDTYNSYHDLLAADGYRGVMNGGAKFGLSVKDNGDNTVTISVYVNGEFKGSQTINKVTDEIDSENATFSVEINAASVTEAIISIS